jgi:hypothetical protein
MRRGVHRLGEAIECIGGQLASRDPDLALKAALLLDRLQSRHADAFGGDPFFRHRVPGELGRFVNNRLNAACEGGGYLYAGLDELTKRLADDKLIAAYLGAGG